LQHIHLHRARVCTKVCQHGYEAIGQLAAQRLLADELRIELALATYNKQHTTYNCNTAWEYERRIELALASSDEAQVQLIEGGIC
jgi:hypothetical protein